MKIQLSMGLLIIGLLGATASSAQTTATPTISLNSGAYTWGTNGQHTIIEDGTPGASIQWCTATTGTCTPSIAYNNEPIYLNPSSYTETICANATASGNTSALACNYYTTWGESGAPTGDTRTAVAEPTFPSGCTVVNATKSVSWTKTVNIDPYNATAGAANGGTGTQGTLGATGGHDFEPSSETPDTAVSSALNGSNPCVELEASGGNSAFVLNPFTIPASKTLIVDAGVTVYMSRDPSAYDTGGYSDCGEIYNGSGINGSHCQPAITMSNGSALMGFGRIDFRGWAEYTSSSRCVNSGTSICSFYYNTIAAFLNSHSKPEYGMPLSPNGKYGQGGAGGFYSPPEAIDIPKDANGVQLYKITLLNTPGFAIQWAGGNTGASCATTGLTIWGVKIIDPFDTDNTDGFDPIEGVCNFTVRDSYISNGDDDSAIKSDTGYNSTEYGNYINIHKYSGLGMAIGSATGGGINNIYYANVFCSGPSYNGAPPSDNRDTCIKVKSPDSSGSDGGAVSNVTYEGLYLQNEGNGIWVYPYYSCPVSTPPTFTNLLFQDVTLGPSQGTLSFQNWSANNEGSMTFNNFTITATGSLPAPNEPGSSCDVSWSGDAYGDFKVGPNPVDSRLVSQLDDTTWGSTVSGTPCTSGCVTPYSASPQPLVGELAVSDSNGTNQLCTPTSQCSVTGSSYQLNLQATLQAGSEYDIMESPQLSASGCPTACTITFWDSIGGAAPVELGTAPLSGNGVTATYSATITASGKHVITASYPGDSNYLPYAWGAVVVNLSE